MRRSQRLTWTSNEFFAHKKNVSEDVKLREIVHSIECRHGLMKEAMRQDIGLIRTELRQIRRSTGHSIDALPPTPFRLQAEQSYCLFPPIVTEDGDAEIPSEFNYLIEEAVDKAADSGERCDTSTRGPEDQPSLHTPRDNDMQLVTIGNDTKEIHLPPLRLARQNQNGLSRDKGTKDQAVTWQVTRRENSLSSSSSNLQSPADLNIALKTWDNLLAIPTSDITRNATVVNRYLLDSNDQSKNMDQEIKQEMPGFLPPIHIPVDTDKNQTADSDERNREGGYDDPKLSISRQISDVILQGEWKRREYVRKNSFVGFDPWVTDALRGHPSQGQSKPTQSKRNLNGVQGSTGGDSGSRRKARATSYRDARTRCRTCQERFRLNAEFQRQKFEQEKEALLMRESESERRVFNQAMAQYLDPDDLDSLFSREVLDWEDKKKVITHYKRESKRRGYSRKRLNELAEPRRGTRRRPLYSKRLISKELDTLTARHDAPQLTDREKENLRMLESKVRTFLATMQEELRPVSMVHIPQRDDIMKVDISHLS